MEISSTLSVLLREIEDCLTEAACTDETAAQRLAISRGMKTVQVLLQRFPDDYQTHHALGVLWYHHPDKTAERSGNVKEALKRALELNSASQFSIQYLAYIYFDERDFQMALSYYQQTDRKFFEGEGQLWRWLKAWESAIACRIRLDPTSLSRDEIQRFIGEYQEAEARGEDPAVQSELWRSLTELPVEFRGRYSDIIAVVRQFVIQSGHESIL